MSVTAPAAQHFVHYASCGGLHRFRPRVITLSTSQSGTPVHSLLWCLLDASKLGSPEPTDSSTPIQPLQNIAVKTCCSAAAFGANRGSRFLRQPHIRLGSMNGLSL